jgi:hypothetical protein
VQVAEQQVILAQVLDIARDRLLHLDDELALLVERGGVGRDVHADAAVFEVGKPALDAGLGLDPHLVAATDQVRAGGRHEGDAAFQGLGLARDADTHVLCSDWSSRKKKRRKRGAARAVW